MSEKMKRANRMLDRACEAAGMDPVEVRIAMFNTIKDRQRAVLAAEAALTSLAEDPPNTEPNPAWMNGR